MGMQKFLLLRNNKETGPFSVEELEQLGLKPYDLIWVNGKSAAWRYPGEVDELKSFAPPVEEQPYDRFYKKPVEEIQKQIATSRVEGIVESVANGNGNADGNGNSLNIAIAPPSPKKEKEYKRVFVTMPFSAAPSKKQIVAEPTPVAEPLPIIAPKKTDPIPEVLEEQRPQKIQSRYDNLNGQSTIDIYYTRRKSFFSQRSFLVAAIGIGVLALVGLGIFIGLSLQQPLPKEAGKQETEKVYRVSDNEGGVPS